jgi:hypothetical protein
MKRVSITLAKDLEAATMAYVHSQEAQPSLTAVIQAALRQFLTRQGYLPTREPRGSAVMRNQKRYSDRSVS